MAKRKDSGIPIGAIICFGLGALAIVAGLAKENAPRRHCPWCDAVLTVTSLARLVCSECGGAFSL